MSSETTEVMTVKQAAEYLQINPKTLYRWLAEGRVPGKKLSRNMWRILKDDLDAWLGGGDERGGASLERISAEEALDQCDELRERILKRRGRPFPDGYGARLIREGRR